MAMQILLNGTLSFYEYWHAGSGTAGAGDADDTPVRDRFGLPYFPGRSLKGLFHEACCQMAALESVPVTERPTEDEIQSWFGQPGNQGWSGQAALRFSNAEMAADLAAYLHRASMQEGLFELLSSTAIEDSGVAKSRSLRRYEVAVPVELHFTLEVEPDRLKTAAMPRIENVLRSAAALIRRAGKFRNNGLGRCRISFHTDSLTSQLS